MSAQSGYGSEHIATSRKVISEAERFLCWWGKRCFSNLGEVCVLPFEVKASGMNKAPSKHYSRLSLSSVGEVG